MLTEKQLQERKGYIGSSDAASVLGLNRWATPLKVWAIKTGAIEQEDISQKLQVKLGHKMEEIVAELFEEETGKKVRKVNETIYHKKYPFIAANIDRRVVGENAILELKTTSIRKSQEWKDEEIPQEYIVQVMHQLAVTDMPYAYICCLIGNEDLKIQKIERDEKLLSDIIRKEVDFWTNYVVPKVMPEVVTKFDGSTLYSLFPDSDPQKTVKLDAKVDALLDSIESLDQDAKNIQGIIEKQKNEIRAMLGDAEVGETNLYRISWKTQIKKAYEVKESKTRVFRYKKIGDEK